MAAKLILRFTRAAPTLSSEGIEPGPTNATPGDTAATPIVSEEGMLDTWVIRSILAVPAINCVERPDGRTVASVVAAA